MEKKIKHLEVRYAKLEKKFKTLEEKLLLLESVLTKESDDEKHSEDEPKNSEIILTSGVLYIVPTGHHVCVYILLKPEINLMSGKKTPDIRFLASSKSHIKRHI